MNITWSIPVCGERLSSSRGDLVRARSLIEALRADGHDVRVVEDAQRHGANAVVFGYRRMVRWMLPRRAALVVRDLGRCLHARAHGCRVAAEARKQGAHLIIETQVHFAGSGALAARLAGVPLILDDCSPCAEEVALGAGLPGVARRVFRQQLRAASVVVAVSKVMRDQLITEGAPPATVRLVPNGIDLNAYASVDRTAMRAQLGLVDRCVLGFLGSFQPWHRIDLLVDAFSKLVRHYPVHLLLIGEGPSLKPALATIRRLGVDRYVTALGSIPSAKVPPILVSCDVGVLPGFTTYGHPMKLMEYAAASLPSVAPDLASVREVLEHGTTGLLFPTENTQRLSTALAQLAANERLRCSLGERARRRVANGASWTDRARALVPN